MKQPAADRRLNFEPSSYLNEQAKRQPMYRVSIASVIGKSCTSVSYYRAKARRLGLLGALA